MNRNTDHVKGFIIMYKKQMMLQRILCILMIVISAVVFVYALGYMTDANDMIRDCALGYEPDINEDPEVKAAIEARKVPMRQYMQDMNLFDRDLVRIGIALILISLTLLLTNTHIRRKYYISNYIAILINAVAAFAASIWAHQQIIRLKSQYYSGAIDFEYVRFTTATFVRENSVNVYTESAFWFDAHYYIFGAMLLIAALLILNAIWKTILMRREKEALAMGRTGD